MLVLHSLAVGHEGASNLQFLPVSPERSITTPVFKTFFFEIWLPGWEAPPIRGWTLAPPSAGVSDHQWVQRFLMSRLWGRQSSRGPAGPPGPGSPPGARQSSQLQWLTVVLTGALPVLNTSGFMFVQMFVFLLHVFLLLRWRVMWRFHVRVSRGFKGHSTVSSWRTNRLSQFLSFTFFHFVLLFLLKTV